MSQLLDFLLEHSVEDLREEIVISERLKDFKFTIRAMASDEFSEFQRLSTTIRKGGKVDFNSQRFNELVVVNCTVEPNFKDAEAIKKAQCYTPEKFLNRSLLAGEVAELAQKISALSGFDKSLNDEVDEAKNF